MSAALAWACFAGGADAVADAAPEVDLVVEVERKLEIGYALIGVGCVEVGAVGGARWPPTEGETPMVGESPERLYWISARAWRKRASAALRSWFSAAILGSSSLS